MSREVPLREVTELGSIVGMAHSKVPLSNMSESAAKFKLFLLPPLHQLARVDTLQTAGAEDKPLLGSKLSADSGANTRLGPVLS